MTETKSNDELNDYIEVIKEAEQQAEDQKKEKPDTDFLKLEADYKEAIKEVDLLKDQLVRNLADTDNLRKRTAKQIEDANKFAVSNFAKDLIEVLENLYLANSNIPEEKLQDDNLLKTIHQGVEMTQKTLVSIFEKYGIKRIYPAIGDIFDHSVHEAVSQVEAKDAAPNTILNVMRAGYTLHERLLKPAMVIVVKAEQK